MVDTVQANEEEISGLDLQHLSEEETVGHMLTLGVKGVLVTRVAKGVTLYADVHKKTVRCDVPGVPVNGPETLIGPGDVFGAAFFSKYVKSGDLKTSAEFAVGVAACTAATPVPT